MIKVLAVDIGFAATGMAVFALSHGQPARLISWLCVHTKPESKKRGIYVSHDDVRRACEVARRLTDYYLLNECKGIVVELPSGGAQGAKANRAMGIATGVIATVSELMRCPAEWVTPNESRKAAIGRETAPKGKEVKAEVIAAVGAKYGEILALPKKDREHIADAIATFIAAENRQMMRTLGNN